jgi:transcriptional regulator with XRE-family HTH domain
MAAEMTPEELKTITARNIARLRGEKHLTQYELGLKLNYSDKAVSRWERGEAIPDAFVLRQMSELFGVTVDTLLRDADKETARKGEKMKKQIDAPRVMMISILGIWALALLVFIVLHLAGITQFIIFVYALPVSLITLLVLNSKFGKVRMNLYIISGLIWSLLFALYMTFFTFMHANWWILFLLGIPAQLIVLLSFKKPKPELRADEKPSDMPE